MLLMGSAMLKKRLIGVVTVKNGWAVQSMGYKSYLPLGRPATLVENLDRWGADEILLQCIDRSKTNLGPDFCLLERIGRIGLSTPLIYSGGIRTAEDGVQAVKLGADRLCVDAMLHDNPSELGCLSRELGAQALIVNLPVGVQGESAYWFNYRTQERANFDANLFGSLDAGCFSELMLSDFQHEGHFEGFDERILQRAPVKEFPLIVFGGLSSAPQIHRVLKHPQVCAAAVGNFLNYREHAIQEYKQELNGIALRPAAFFAS